MQAGGARRDWYLIALILFALVYFSAWVTYSNSRYQNFQADFSDMGIAAYSYYWRLNGVSGLNPMQYIVFFRHLCPVCVLALPFFALYEQPVTLIAFQAALLALTALAAYFVCNDLLKNRKLAFTYSFAFMVNLGIAGLLDLDVHPQMFVPLFVLASFYFYLKGSTRYFVVSYALLMGVMESTDVVGLAMLVALLLYELLYAPKATDAERIARRKRISLLAAGLLLTVLAFLFYYFGTLYVYSTYQSTSYSLIAPITRLNNYVAAHLSGLAQPPTSYNPYLYVFAIVGLLVFFLGFGPYPLRVPLLLLVVISPWLLEVFIGHNLSFAVPFYEYYSYFVSGSMLVSILGLKVYTSKSHSGRGFLGEVRRGLHSIPQAYVISFPLFELASVLPYFFAFPLGVSPAQAQISSALQAIPANSTVMAQSTMRRTSTT